MLTHPHQTLAETSDCDRIPLEERPFLRVSLQALAPPTSALCRRGLFYGSADSLGIFGALILSYDLKQ